jgi:general secretion pathway protein L
LPADWATTIRGSRVEVLLTSGQVLFRSLDFPKQAVDFLDGMIRAQIDRLTPWTADDVVFGWSPPSPVPNGRVELTLAATSKQELQPIIQLATGLEAASVAAFAALPPQGARLRRSGIRPVAAGHDRAGSMCRASCGSSCCPPVWRPRPA